MRGREVGIGAGLLSLAALAILVIFPLVAREPADSPPIGEAMQAFEPARPPRPAPRLSFQRPGGSAASLEDFAGKVVLLNLWATWCAPCVREMPTLDALEQEMGGDDFHVVALSSDRQGAAVVEPFLREHRLEHLTAYLDPTGDVARALGVRGLPTTVLVDRRGYEAGRLEGVAEWDSAEAKRLIRYYMER